MKIMFLCLLASVLAGCTSDGDGCEQEITGFLIDEARECVDTSQEIVLGCRDLDLPSNPLYTCYRDAGGVRVGSDSIYHELEDQGWTECERPDFLHIFRE